MLTHALLLRPQVPIGACFCFLVWLLDSLLKDVEEEMLPPELLAQRPTQTPRRPFTAQIRSAFAQAWGGLRPMPTLVEQPRCGPPGLWGLGPGGPWAPKGPKGPHMLR